MSAHDSYPDTLIREVLSATKTIAVVGISANENRPSYFVFKYLMARGFTMIGVNPGLAGQTLLGAPIYASLKDVPVPIDMVDIFRNSEAAGPIVDEALALEPKPKFIWMQLSVRNDEAAARAEAKGVTVIMNRCPKIEHGRFSGEIGWMGVNRKVIDNRKPLLFGKGGSLKRL